MADGWDGPEKLDVLTRRLELLRRLREAPAHKRDLIDDLDRSRSTIDRAVSELERVNLVERGDEGVALTASGRVALKWFERFQRGFDDVVAADDVLAPLPADAMVPPDAVVGSEPLLAAEPASYRPLERFHADLADAARYRAVLPSLDDPRHVRLLYEHVVTHGRPAELVVPPALVRTLREEFPRRASVLADAESFEVYVGEVPPYALALVESAGDEPAATEGSVTVHLVVFSESGAVHGSLANRDADAVDWAAARYDAVRAAADERTDALTADPDGGVLDADGGVARATIGRSLPATLERAGFVRLDVGFFGDAPVSDPTTAWRAGLSIPEVHTGYAVERVLDDDGADAAGDEAGPTGSDDATAAAGETLTDALLARLGDGEDCLLVGPPGSGKSTACKRVACEWYDADRGPVLYREGGRGRAFESVADLTMAADIADGHTLVVVEDAVRPDADAVFDAVDRLGDRDDVSFLLDARESEWRDPPGDPVEADGLAVEAMPPLSTADVERVVAHFERTADATVDVPAARLRDSIREGVPTDDAAAPGEVLLLLHRLATYADPLADGETSLETAVGAVLEDVAGDDIALDVAVLANALNVAGLDVAPSALYAVADEESFPAVTAALERLDGQVLFGRPDESYRTVHESWSATFLARFLDREADAAERFGRVISALLALADDPDRRAAIGAHLGRDPLPGLAADPEGWADETVRQLYAAGRERPQLAPLFGDGATDTVDLPAACTDEVAGERPLWLARMLEAAGDYAGAERALDRLADDGDGRAVERRLGVARVAADRGDYETARTAAGAVLSEVDMDEAATTAGRGHLRLAEALRNLGHYEAAAAHYRVARETFERAGDRRRQARTLDGLGHLVSLQGEHEAAGEYYRRARDIYRELGDRRGLAESLQGLGLVSRYAGEYDAAREYHERSLELFRRLGDPQGEADSLGNLGTVAYRGGNYDRAREYHERSLELSRQFDDRQGVAASLANLGLALEGVGSYDEARERHRESLDLHDALGLRHAKAASHNNLGSLARRRGDYGTARDHFEAALAIGEDIGAGGSVALYLDNLGEIARLQGEYDAAREYHERSLEALEEVDNPKMTADTLDNLGVVARLQGDHEAAREYHERSLAMTMELGAGVEARCRAHLAALDRHEGAYDRATDRLDTALDCLDGADEPVIRGRVLLTMGRVALDRGNSNPDPDRARDRAEQARAAFATAEAVHWIGRARRLLGRVAAQRGDGDTAREHLTAARETFEEVGAPQDALATIQAFVEADLQPATDDGFDPCRRAKNLLATAPAAVADRHREWVERECRGAASD